MILTLLLAVTLLHLFGVVFGLYKKLGMFYCFFPHLLFGMALGLYFNDPVFLPLILIINILWEVFERMFSHFLPGLSSKTEIHARGVEPVFDVCVGVLGALLILYA